MFLFISIPAAHLFCFFDIQIHLMFLFILLHPYFYPPFLLYSNTSHVLIYLLILGGADPDTKFKYISCSYLSKITVMKFLFLTDSNTSHVLIYPVSVLQQIYIPYIQIHLMFLFIHFAHLFRFTFGCIQIHLMFLFIGTRVLKRR